MKHELTVYGDKKEFKKPGWAPVPYLRKRTLVFINRTEYRKNKKAGLRGNFGVLKLRKKAVISKINSTQKISSNLQAPAQIYWIRNSTDGAQQSVFLITLQMILVFAKPAEPLVLPNITGNTGKESSNWVGTDDDRRERLLVEGAESRSQKN